MKKKLSKGGISNQRYTCVQSNTSVPFSLEILVWYWKVCSQGRVSHDPISPQGLADMQPPETVEEVIHLLSGHELVAYVVAANGGGCRSLASVFFKAAGGCSVWPKKLVKKICAHPPAS